MTTMRATVRWATAQEGGRSRPPTGEGKSPYSTIVRFAGQPWPAPTAWSLVVEKIREIGPYIWDANIRFLVAEAPEELLSAGNEFDLYEGNKRVASGKIEEPVLSAH